MSCLVSGGVSGLAFQGIVEACGGCSGLAFPGIVESGAGCGLAFQGNACGGEAEEELVPAEAPL